MKSQLSNVNQLVAIISLLALTLAKKLTPDPDADPEPTHTRSKHHENAKPLSFWESRAIFMKSHDKSEAKIYIALIAIFGCLLTFVLVCVGIVCWKDQAQDREIEEQQQLNHKMMVYENEQIVSGQDINLLKSNSQRDGLGGSTVGKEGGQFSHRSLQSLSPRQRSSSFIKANLQEGYISGKQLNPMTAPPVSQKEQKERENSPKSKSSVSTEPVEQRRPSFIRMWGQSTEMTTVKHQQSSQDTLDGGLSTHQSSKQNIFGNSGQPSHEAKQRQTSHFGVIKEEEENSINNSEAQSKQFKGYQVLPNEEQRTGADIETEE